MTETAKTFIDDNITYAHPEIDQMNERAEITEKMAPAESLVLAQQAYSLSLASNYPEGVARSLFLMGRSHWRLGNLVEANHCLLEAYDHVKTLSDIAMEADILNALGNVHLYLKIYDQAFTYYQKSLNLSRSSNNRYTEARTLNNIGEIYRDLKSYSLALDFYTMSHEIYQTLDNPGFESVTVSNLGALYMEMHELDKAEDYTKRALVMARNEKNLMIESACLQYLGVIAKEKGHIEEALQLFNESLDVYKETRELIHEAEVLLEFHKLYFEQGDTALSLQYLNEAMLIAEEVSSNTLISDICSELTTLHESLGNDNEALKFAKRRFEAIETVEQQERDQRLRGIGIQLEADLSFQEKESYRILSQKLERKAQQLEERSEELAETYHTLKAINNIGKTITATLSLEEIFDLVYHYVTDLMQMDVFGIGLYNPELDIIDYRYLIEDNKRLYDARIPMSSTSSWAVWCFRNQKEIMVNSVEEDHSGLLSHFSSSAGNPMAAVMFNPLIVEDTIIGVITVQSKVPNVYNIQTQEILGTLSAYLSIAIQNAQKSEKLQEEIRQREHAQQELSKLNKELAELSELDGLTGIANRRRFDEFFLQEWNRAIRAKQNISLLMIDIDFFKQYNDHYGHLSGDEIIIRIAHLIKESVKRSSDIVARFGGDEFIVLLSDTDAEGAKIVAKNIQNALLVCGIKHNYSEICPKITLSIGIAVMTPNHDLQPSLLIQKGDLALYMAKQSGRNQVKVFGT